MDVNQYEIIKKVRTVLQDVPATKGISVNDEHNPTELQFCVGIGKASIALKESFVRARFDVTIDDPSYSEDDIKITGAKYAEIIKESNLDANQAIDQGHITLMCIIQYDRSENGHYDQAVKNILAFCTAIRTGTVQLIGITDEASDIETLAAVSDNDEGNDDIGTLEFNSKIEDNHTSAVDIEKIADVEQITASESRPLNDILAQLAETEADLASQKNKASAEDDAQGESRGARKKRHRKRRSRDRTSPDERTAEVQQEQELNEQPEEELNDEIAENIRDALSPEHYETYPELAVLRDRLYKQTLDYMKQAEKRVNAREKKLDAYKAELGKMSENIKLSQQAFKSEVAKTRQQIADEQEASRQAVESEKQQALADIQKEREDLEAKIREHEFQVSQLDAARQSYELEKAELDEDRRLFEQKIELNKDAPEFVHEQLVALQSDNETLREKLNETATLTEDIEKANAQIKEMQQKIQQMVPIETASIDPEELESLRERLNAVMSENEKYQKISTLQKDALAAYQDELDKANQAMTEYRSELEQAKKQAAQSDVSADPREIESLKERIMELLDENKGLKADASTSKENTELLQAQNKDLREQIDAIKSKYNDSRPGKPRYTMEEAMSELSEAGIEADIKPGNGSTFLTGSKNGCSINVNFERDFVYIEKRCRNTKRYLGNIDEWNQDKDITYNYWCDANRVMCRIDYILRPNSTSDIALSRMILKVCENLDSVK